MRESIKYGRSADEWFARAEQLWEKYRKSVSMSLWDRWNYQQGVIGQGGESGYLVMYNRNGSNISSLVLGSSKLPIVNGARPQAFIADYGVYWCRANSADEAHYLCSVLNSPTIDGAIESYQPRGIYVGPRDITRLPFEVCPIPEFDAANADHLRLAELSQAAHAAVAALDLREGGVVAARKKTREAAREHIRAIDVIARRLLSLPASDAAAPIEDSEDESEEDEEANGSGK